jgi:hypothetical protein
MADVRKIAAQFGDERQRWATTWKYRKITGGDAGRGRILLGRHGHLPPPTGARLPRGPLPSDSSERRAATWKYRKITGADAGCGWIPSGCIVISRSSRQRKPLRAGADRGKYWTRYALRLRSTHWPMHVRSLSLLMLVDISDADAEVSPTNH